MHGDGPFLCGAKLEGCGKEVMFADCVIDHVDEDHRNNDPENWQPMHPPCHARKSALADGRGNRVHAMNDHPSNSKEARSARMKEYHRKKREARGA